MDLNRIPNDILRTMDKSMPLTRDMCRLLRMHNFIKNALCRNQVNKANHAISYYEVTDKQLYNILRYLLDQIDSGALEKGLPDELK